MGRNVLDDFFYLKNASSDAVLPPDGIKTILHICCFCEEQKNNFGLLRAVKELSRERNDFRLIMVGTGVDFDTTRNYAEKLRLTREKVEFMGKIQPPEVKQQLEKSCFLVSFSNYETASVVFYESLACGKPVVVTAVGGVTEIMCPQNGILVKAGDEADLKNALSRMLDTYQTYDSADISHRAEEFSFARVGEKYSRIYQSAVSKSK